MKLVLMLKSRVSIATRHAARSVSTGPALPLSLTLFTKETCSLCVKARAILDNTTRHHSMPAHTLTIVDITDPAHSTWFDRYCFDVPVLHVERDKSDEQPVKFMHYFDKEKLLREFTKL